MYKRQVLLPCDDPEWSNFARYFAANFTRFGLKKLISTSYAKGLGNQHLTLLEQESPLYDASKHDTHGKVFTLTRDKNDSGNIDTDDIEFSGYLEGDGDFRSAEVKALRREVYQLRRDMLISMSEIARFSRRTSDMVEAWDAEGMPGVRA